MDEYFEIPVLYKGQEINLISKLLIYGYSHKIEVDVNGNKVLFEPDEERSYRAVVNEEQTKNVKKADIELLKLIAQAIESIVSKGKNL